jgi:hypothetical protein
MNIATEAELRANTYEQCGLVFATTVKELGHDLPDETVAGWARTMGLLSEADTLSEQDPECMGPEGLLEMLGLDPSDTRLNIAAANLIAANQQSLSAQTMGQHFSARTQEARSTTDLLRFQSEDDISSDDGLWDQLDSLAIVGIHVDSLIDCREDSRLLPQFSAGQLAKGSLVHAIKTLRHIKPDTLAASYRSAKKLGMRSMIVKRLLKGALVG